MVLTILTTEDYTEQIRYIAIRKMAGNIKDVTRTDDELNDIVSRMDARVFKLTDNSNWEDDNPDTPNVISASNCYAAAEVLTSFATATSNETAKTLTEKADGIIALITGVSTDGTVLQGGPMTKTRGFNGPNKGTLN